LDAAQVPRKLLRWQKIASEAAEQSRRSVSPRVLAPMSLEQWLESEGLYETVLVAWEDEDKRTLKQVFSELGEIKKLTILIGPEGGFAVSEMKEINKRGGISVSLGPRILRSETASMVMLSLALFYYGDMGER
jgi:16S rRNA (uracil1498-N3)-methyltransferase